MKKTLLLLCIIFIFSLYPLNTHAENITIDDQIDSRLLQYQDMIMVLLSPEIDKAVAEYYSGKLTETPVVYPYQIEVTEVERVNGFRGFHFSIAIIVNPVVGPHISVGKDQLIFQVSPTINNKIKLIQYEHIETHDLPKHWNDIKITG